MPLKEFLRNWFSLSLVLHLLAAVFCVGFEQADEFFQVHEFVAYKLGKIEAEALPWEFGERMRPWAAPGVLYLLCQSLDALGFSRPSTWAFGFRLLSALIGWASVVGFLLAGRPWFSSEKSYRRTVVLASLFWCLPYLHARTSSENWGGSFFMLGLAAAVYALRSHQARTWYLLAGLLWGFAYQFRYQTGLLIVGSVAWFALRAKDRRILWALPTGLAIWMGGILIDRWGYGEWTLAQWNYLAVNLIEGKAASQFGASPWWQYVQSALWKVPPMGALGFFFLVLGWCVRPFHVLAWAGIPFVLVHQLLSHKELRFLYPLVPLLPFFAMFCYERVAAQKKAVAHKLYFVFLGLNVLYLPLGVLTPAKAWESFYGAVDRYAAGGTVHLRSLDPLPYDGRFFTFPELDFEQVAQWPEVKVPTSGTLLLLTRGHASPRNDLSCERVFTSHPEWWKHFSLPVPGLNWLERTTIWSLFKCKGA